MALTRVRVKINGVWTVLTYDSSTGRYEGDITAPQTTSANLPGGYYVLEADATNGTTTTSITGAALRSLRLVVRETAAPSLVLVSPPAGYINTTRPVAVLTASDEAGGSGIAPDSFAVTVDGRGQNEGLSATADGEAYRLTWTAAEDLPEGPHIVTYSISDKDGNTSTVSAAYTVDVTPPGLTLELPDSHRVVDSETIPVAGQTWDGISGPPVVVITVNGIERWRTPAPTGPSTDAVDFAADIPLEIAANDIEVTATDGAGLTTVEQFRVIRLVTDRVQADLDKLQDMFARGLNNWTAAEKAWFETTLCHRGGYDYLDVNRVELATDWIGGWLHHYGYFEDWFPPVEWAPDGAMTLSDAIRYIDRVATLRGSLTVPEGTPETPETLRFPTLQKANDIETILVAIDALRPLLERSCWYSGEIFAGRYDMTDGVIKGTGNSRYIKFPPNMLSMYPDYDSYIADGVAGKLPVDFFGINPDGWKTLGTLLNKANLLSDATGAMLGLGSTGTVNSALAVLAKYNQYWWRRITIKSSSSSTVTVASTDLSYYYIFTYSDEITINGPNVILKTPTNYTGNPTNDTISALSFLVNKFFTYGGTIYYCTGLGTKTGSGTTSAPYVFTVKATPVTVGAEIYVQGNSEKTYPSYGHSGNYYYIPLGRPLDLFKTPSLAYMEYIGTGTYGEANPTSITFPFVPKLVYIFATPVSESDASSYNYIFPRYATKYFSSNGSAFFSIESVMWINTNPQYDVPIKAYVGDREKSGGLLALTFSGNTLSFFTKAMGDLINADARAQLNQANKKYSVFAFS